MFRLFYPNRAYWSKRVIFRQKNAFFRALARKPSGTVLGAKTEPKSIEKRSQNVPGDEKRDFVKIVLFLKRQHDFQGSGPPKIHEKATKIGSQNKAPKMQSKRGQGSVDKKSVCNRSAHSAVPGLERGKLAGERESQREGE